MSKHLEIAVLICKISLDKKVNSNVMFAQTYCPRSNKRSAEAQWLSVRLGMEGSLVQYCFVSLSNTRYPLLCLILGHLKKTEKRPDMTEHNQC